jgi:N-acetyl-anhydromuramyl-L-alanine amidase AmpD
VQGQTLYQREFTPQQYESLVKLTAALCIVLPRITCDYPRDERGRLVTRKLPDDVLRSYHGLLGHYHVQTNKVDPGPAFDWDLVVQRSRKLMRGG